MNKYSLGAMASDSAGEAARNNARANLANIDSLQHVKNQAAEFEKNLRNKPTLPKTDVPTGKELIKSTPKTTSSPGFLSKHGGKLAIGGALAAGGLLAYNHFKDK